MQPSPSFFVTIIAVKDRGCARAIPSVVVLGGGVSNLDELYEDGVAVVRRWVFNHTLETRIVRHALGDSAGVLGAALLP